MSKTKLRCTTCGKWFQSANAKDLTCPDCVQKARREKAAAKNAAATSTKTTGPVGQTPRPVPQPPPKPKPVQSGTNQWLDSLNDVRIAQPEQPQRPKIPSSPPVPRDSRGDMERKDRGERGNNTEGTGSSTRDRDERGERGPRPYQNDRGPGGQREGGNRGQGGYRDNEYRSPSAYRVTGGSGLSGTLGQRPRQPMEGGPGRSPRPSGGLGNRQDKPYPQGGKPKVKIAKPPAPPRPKKEKIPPPPPFVPTPEQVAQVETRYLELAIPAEFDGIRTQIAQELSIPKTAVKKIIKELRDRQHIPSWWEIQTYKGSEEEMATIRAAYEPFLPIPPIGVHKTLAEQLTLKPGDVYQAIKMIRQEMNLPQYNDPSVHGLDAVPARPQATKQESATEVSDVSEANEAPTSVAEQAEAPLSAVETDTLEQ